MSVAQQWLTLAVAFGSLVALMVAGYRGMRRWVQRAAADAQEARRQVTTSNGKTVAGYVEQTARQLETLASQVSASTDLATRALHKAEDAAERLDAHLLGHGKP